jgi:hypothetical protein
MNEMNLDPNLSQSKHKKSLAKGLDVGTANLVCATEYDDGSVVLNHERNAFLDIECDPFTRSLLTRQQVPYAMFDGTLYVLGQPAFEFANIVSREVRRPMSGGMISPTEANALPLVKLLIEKIADRPQNEPEPLCFSVPAPPVDSQMNVAYHQGIITSVLSNLGYHPFVIQEGLAVIYSELADEDFTGIGISFGGGMVNVCMAYRSVPAISFSVVRSGDWIDGNAAEVLGMKAARLTMLKERGINILAPRTREEEAIAIYYQNLIRYVAQQIRHFMLRSDQLPHFSDSVELICAGGTTLVDGFLPTMKQEFDQVDFPLSIGEVRRAQDPLNATVRGCLVAAVSSQEG